MSQSMTIGNSVQPLRNVAALAQQIKKLDNRKHGLPGIGVFHSPPGYGKTYAAIFAASSPDLDAIHISVQDAWTRKTLIKQVLKELGAVARGTLADMAMDANEQLASAGRPLLIDEADYVVDKGFLQTVRDLADGSHVPVILIGMEELPQKIRKWGLVDGRTYNYTPAQPANLKDARFLASYYCPGIAVSDDLLEYIVSQNTGNARRISVDLAYVEEQANAWGSDSVSLKDWGNTPFLRGDAPAPRHGLK